MAHHLQYSPFVSVSGSTSPLLNETEVLRDGSLDHLGMSTAGYLYWNGHMDSLGLVCGSFENEMATIIRRLIASHMKDPEAQVLVLHTDHLSIRRGPCSLLDSTGARPLVLVSPYASTRVVKTYTSRGILVAPFISKEPSITLRHILALFTPPAGMKGASSILGTIQLILSQLGEPFDLQRFIELVDQEQWSEDGVNFMALRQTLLTKLLSPPLEDAHQDEPRQVLLVDLTDPILWSTGLDGSIMDIALYDFIRLRGGRKLIVLNNCQQYLTHDSNLTKSLEAIATLGNDRPTSIILSSTDPTVVSSSLLNLVDYVILGSTRSLQWSNSLRKHFANIDISKEQSRGARVMIWSPESTSLTPNAVEAASQQPWKDNPAFIDIEQLKQSMLATHADANLTGKNIGANQKASRSPAARQEVISAEISHEYEGAGGRDDEEGIVPLDELTNSFMHGHPSASGPMASSNEPTTSVESLPRSTDQSDIAVKFAPLISVISMLGDGKPGTLVDYKAVKIGMKIRKQEIKRLGWRSGKVGPILTAAYQERVVESIEVNQCIKFLTLLPIPSDSKTFTTHSVALNEEERVLTGENTIHVAASHPETVLATPSSDTLIQARWAGASPGASEQDGHRRPIDHYPDKYVPLIAAILKLSEGCTDYKVTLKALRSELRGVLVTKIMRANAWGTIEEWINQACLERYLRQGSMDHCVWVMVPAANDREALFGNEIPSTKVPVPASSAVPSEPEQSMSNTVRLYTVRSFCDDLTNLLWKINVLPTTIPTHQTGPPVETKATLGLIQTIARFEPLIACISRLGGNSQVAYGVVKQEMRSRKPEIESLGWSDLGMLMEAAYKENVVLPIRKKRNGKIKFLQLILQSLKPSPLPQAVSTEYSMAPIMPSITSLTPEVGNFIGSIANAAEYPLEHRPVVLTMLRLMSVAPGGVPMVELAKALARDFPCREGEYYLISRAGEDGILSTGENSNSGAYLNSPPTRKAPLTASSPIFPLPPPARIPTQNLPLHLNSTPAGTSHHAVEHPLVTSAILELTGGIWDTKVRLSDLHASLRRTCYGAEGMALPLLFQAKQDGLLMDETDSAGTIWVHLQTPPHIGSPAPSNGIPSPSPGPVTSVLKPLTPEDSPLAHREVIATVLKLTRGILGEKIRVADLASSLDHDFPSPQGPWDLIFQAQDKGILGLVKQKKDNSGVTWAYLKHPRPSVVMPLLETAASPSFSPAHMPQAGHIRLATRILSDHSTAMEATTSTSPGGVPTPLPTPAADVDTAPPPQTSGKTAIIRITVASCPPNHRAVVAPLITLTDGTPGKKVRMDEWMSSLRGEYPGSREEFLFSLIAKAEADAVMTRGRSQDGVLWAWLNPKRAAKLIPSQWETASVGGFGAQ